MNNQKKICVVGLGYVGLPLVYELSKYFSICGFDTSNQRVNELKNNFDRYELLKEKDLKKKKKLYLLAINLI